MTDVVFRQGENVILRPFERRDIPILRKWVNDPEITQFLLASLPQMEKQEEEWFEGLHKRPNDFVLGIVEKKENKLIGSIGLHGVNWLSRTASTGTMIGEKEYWSKGYGTEAKMLLLDFAFNTLDLYGIQSRVLDFNGRSLKYANKCGYEKVATIPNWIRRNGKRCDEIILVVTQEKWQPLWREFIKK